ncbi:MAG: hypothetical protein LBU88_07460 [Treponema sp.]|jgi:hypothetical protein|nr:hypothetical protein [Treponema sp.]
MANKPEEFPKFTKLDPAVVDKLMGKIPVYLKNIHSILGINSPSEILVDQDALYEIITRVEMRRVYFHIYHPIEMGELNEGALICFWILKLMPFKHDLISTNLFNVKIAQTLFVKMLIYVAAKTNRKVNLNKELLKNTFYAFRYRDLSKEAIMALAESFLY